jgi:hypothetical protein
MTCRRDHRGAYGSKRVSVELRRRGRRVNRKRVERIMRQRGSVGITRRHPAIAPHTKPASAIVNTTPSRHETPVSRPGVEPQHVTTPHRTATYDKASRRPKTLQR